ncbi:MAG: hypothetical protein JXX14_02075 [Deltaproteobacteria bacterium]|nr:hypothetical protein [Deltaproteobacteria bacterium]
MLKQLQMVLLLLALTCMTGNALGQCEGMEGPCVEDDSSGALTDAASSESGSVPRGTNEPAAVKKERIKPLWISGLIAFGVSYSANIIVTAALAEDEYRGKAVGFAAIPLVGQFISIAADSDDYPIPPDYRGPMILGAMLQIVSAGVFTAGMIIKREPKNKQALHTPRFFVTPVPLGHHGACAVFSLANF